MEDVRVNTLEKSGTVKCTAVTNMVGAAAKSMWLGLDGLARAQQLFDANVFAEVV